MSHLKEYGWGYVRAAIFLAALISVGLVLL